MVFHYQSNDVYRYCIEMNLKRSGVGTRYRQACSHPISVLKRGEILERDWLCDSSASPEYQCRVARHAYVASLEGLQ